MNKQKHQIFDFRVIEQINHEADMDVYIQQTKTGKEIPDLYEFEPYQEVKKKVLLFHDGFIILCLIIVFIF